MRSYVQGAVCAAAIAGMGAAAQAETVFASTLTGSLIRFDSSSPGVIQSAFAIQGLAANENIRGIDFRPATGQLFGLGSFGNLYSLNTGNGQATLIAPLSAALNANSNGVDFNPTVDRLRIISETNQNLRVVPDTGATTVDGALAYAAGDPNFGVDPNGVHAGYTNSFAGATSTTLYVLDTGLDILAIQNPANSGTLITVGSVGADLTEMGGFDISGASGIAYAAVRGVNPDRTTFWTINLATGAGAMVGDVGGGLILTGIAVVPTPGSLALLGVAGLAAGLRRRR